MKSLREELGRELTPSEEEMREGMIRGVARRMDDRLDAATLGAATRGVRGSIAGQYSVIVTGDLSEKELRAARKERRQWIARYVEERTKPTE